MGSAISRRRMLQTAGAAALVSHASARSSPAASPAFSPAAAPAFSPAAAPAFSKMPGEGKDTPKICLGGVQPTDEAGLRRVKQIGVDYVLTGGPRIPWDEADLRGRIERYKAGGITL